MQNYSAIRTGSHIFIFCSAFNCTGIERITGVEEAVYADLVGAEAACIVWSEVLGRCDHVISCDVVRSSFDRCNGGLGDSIHELLL